VPSAVASTVTVAKTETPAQASGVEKAVLDPGVQPCTCDFYQYVRRLDSNRLRSPGDEATLFAALQRHPRYTQRRGGPSRASSGEGKAKGGHAGDAGDDKYGKQRSADFYASCMDERHREERHQAARSVASRPPTT
jgi:hypothetical protein